MNTSGISGNDSWKRLMAAAETARMRNPSLNSAQNTDKTKESDPIDKRRARRSGLKRAGRTYVNENRQESGKTSLGSKFDAYA